MSALDRLRDRYLDDVAFQCVDVLLRRLAAAERVVDIVKAKRSVTGNDGTMLLWRCLHGFERDSHEEDQCPRERTRGIYCDEHARDGHEDNDDAALVRALAAHEEVTRGMD